LETRFQNDKHLEECLVQALIVDRPFAEQMTDILNVEYFNLEYLKVVAKLFFDYYIKYKTFPSYMLLGTLVKNEVSDGALKDQIKAYFLKIHREPLNGDMQYVKEYALDFCRKRSLALALEASLSLIEEKKYEQVAQEIKKALQAGSERDIGTTYQENFENRMKEEVYNPVPTPWPEINKITKGGPGGGKVCVIAASTGVGKSHTLVDIGAYLSMDGYNVVHITLEDSKIETEKRYDARISGICLDNLSQNKDFVEKQIHEKVTGKLIVKSYPAGTASVLTLRNYYNNLVLRDMKPDVMVVDYAELLKSSDHSDTKRFNVEAIFKDLVALAQELNIPIWTAAQSNREGLDVEVLTLKHISECFAIAMIVHLFITINRDKAGPTPELGNMFVAKSKIGKDGIKFPMMINTSISKLEILPSDNDIGSGGDEDESDHMSRLREKFKKFKQSFSSTQLN